MSLSIIGRGSRRQFVIALCLVSLIPLLSFGFIALTLLWPTGVYTNTSRILIAAIAMVLALCGYSLLAKYPRNIERLREYLSDIAAGRIPDKVEMLDVEEDLLAIQQSLGTIVTELRSQVKQLQNQLALAKKMQTTIEEQANEIVAAERQRVMIESLATACHHVAQPATVLRMNLEALRQSPLPENARKKVEACEQAVTALAEVIDRLRRVSEYRTVPYRTYRSDDDKDVPQDRILDIDQPRAASKPPPACSA